MKNSNTLIAIILLAILSFIWGSSFILMKLGMTDFEGKAVFSSGQVAAMRMGFAFILLLPFAVYHLPKIPRKKFIPITLIGLFGNCIPAFLFTAAETKVAPSLAGMLNSSTPLFAVIIARVFFKNHFKNQQYSGLILGFVGSSWLMLANGTDQFYGEVSYSFLVLLATFFYATSVNIIKNYTEGVPPMAVTSVSFVIVGPVTLTYLLTTDFFDVIETNAFAWKSLGFVGILAFFGTALAVMLFNYLVKITNAVYASTVTYLIPITAIFWGILWNEPIGFQHIIAMLIILTGVYLINKK